MMTLCPSEVRIPSARMRAIVSVGPPAAKGTTMTTGRVGKVWADAPVMAAAATSAVRTNLFMDVPVVGKAIARGRHRPRRLLARIARLARARVRARLRLDGDRRERCPDRREPFRRCRLRAAAADHADLVRRDRR